MKELTVKAEIENIETVTDQVNSWLEEIGCPKKKQMEIDIVIDEIFSNISKYAYEPETGMVTVRLEAGKDPGVAMLVFRDQGKQYDPLHVKEPDITLSADKRPVGGLGIFLVKKIMDEVRYEYKDGHNVLYLKKYL